MKQLDLSRPTGFQLAAATEFYAGFTPGSGMAAAATDTLTLAFRLDHGFEPVVVALRERDGALVADYAGTDDESRVRVQLARILGLDADGEAWAAVGRRDPVVGALQREFPGFFTAAKASPYDAATWAVIAPRTSMARAATVKIAIAREHGDAIELHGHVHHVFPAPAVLETIEQIAGLADEKVERLRGIGRAARAGRLDPDRLLALGEDAALADLQQLRGIGPWAASHIYYRGVAPVDALPTGEPRVLHGLAHAYGIAVPTEATFREIAETWRPFRMWVSILLSRHLARTDGWKAPTLSRERAAAGKELARRTRRAARTARSPRAVTPR